MKMSDAVFLETKPNRTDLKIQNPKKSAYTFWFSKNWLLRFAAVFTLSHSQFIFQNDRISKVFLFVPYLCTSSSESLRLTFSWTNLVWKDVISSNIL